MAENILLIIRDIESPKRKIKIAPGVLNNTNQIVGKPKANPQVLNTPKPLSPVVGKKIILRPKPIYRPPMRRGRMKMTFL